MRRLLVYSSFALLFVGFRLNASAQEILVPAESLGASPSAAPGMNCTAIQTALNVVAPGGEVTLLSPGIFQTNCTAVLPSGGNIRLRLGPKTRLQTVTGGQGVPLLVTSGFNTRATFTSVTLSWTSGQTFSVNWNSHGLVAGQYVWLSYSTQALNQANQPFVGVFQIQSITDANDFVVTSTILPTAAPATGTQAKVVDTNIEITGGIWDYNYPANTTPTNQLNATAIVVGVAEHVWVHDIKCTAVLKYCVEVSAVRDYALERIGLDYSGNSTSGDVIKQYGPLYNGKVSQIFGHNNDDMVSVSVHEPPFFVALTWTNGGPIQRVDIEDVACENTGIGSCVAIYPHPVFVLDDITIKNIHGCLASTGNLVQIANPGTNGYSSAVFAGNITLDTIGGCATTNPTIFAAGASGANLNVSSLIIRGLTDDINDTARTQALFQTNSNINISHLTLDHMTNRVAGWNGSGAGLYMAYLDGTGGTVDISAPVIAPTGGSGGARLLGIVGTWQKVNIRDGYGTNCATLIGTTSLSNTPIYTFTDNNFSCTEGLDVNSNSTVVATGNYLNAMTSGLMKINGSFTVSYASLHNTLAGGSVLQTISSGSPTVNSFVEDVSGNVTTSGTTATKGGSTIIYRCTVAGAARLGALTSVSADCGTAVDSGLRLP